MGEYKNIKKKKKKWGNTLYGRQINESNVIGYMKEVNANPT
jgi:hypothetical protein